MPPESKRPIEELLEASAKARRGEFGADQTMPNPVRARLQEEIARLDREDQPQRRRSWFVIFWPQFSIGAAVAAMLVTASILFWGHRPDTGSLADNTTESRPTAGDGSAQGLGERARADDVAQPTRPAASESSGNLASAAAIAPAPAAGNFQQQFSQTARSQARRSDSKSNQAPGVLNNFQVEKDGREIRFVDNDGSIYVGKLEVVAQDGVRSLAREEPKNAAPVTTKRAKEANENDFYFRARGYNGSLKKELVFEGNYRAPRAPQQSVAGDVRDDDQAPARIVGTAKIPGESPIEIDAIAR